MFAEGDLQRIAATLASIRQGLALVGNVPEFRGGSAKLAVCCPFPCIESEQNSTIHELPYQSYHMFLARSSCAVSSGTLLPYLQQLVLFQLNMYPANEVHAALEGSLLLQSWWQDIIPLFSLPCILRAILSCAGLGGTLQCND